MSEVTSITYVSGRQIETDLLSGLLATVNEIPVSYHVIVETEALNKLRIIVRHIGISDC